MNLPRTGRFSRRAILAFLLSGVASPVLAKAPESSLRPTRKPGDAKVRALPQVDKLVSAAKLGGKVSYAVADAKTGEMLEVYNPLSPHPPASVTKAVTTLYALDTLGPAHRFRTQVIATGPIENGILEGDLVLVGGGDPTLNTDHLMVMAGRLKTAGLREVRGKFKVFGGHLAQEFEIDSQQPHYLGYNPGLSGLNLNFNRVFLEWKQRGKTYDIVMDARAANNSPSVGFARTRVVDRRTPIFTYADSAGRDLWTVARHALGKKGGRWLPVRKPAIYAGDVFQTLARSHGLVLPYPELTDELPEGVNLAETLSPPLAEICKGMLKYSTNLTAEVLGLSASRADSLDASAAHMSGWMRDTYGVGKARFLDHSGLGDASHLSAHEMVRALVGAQSDGRLQGLLKEIQPRDAQNRGTHDANIKIAAKTGTLNFVSSLAGYVTTGKGRVLAFAVFTSDTERRAALAKAERERPRGARSWSGRSRKLQHQFINRWAVKFEA
jgi:D-alanyl-D-alanine carboxypeptidase/D-alanyl-D-alanine-endopeptidase (penicillin-binding protein 4)